MPVRSFINFTAMEALKKRKICIFGGSFDPITYGHVSMVSKICESKQMNEVWVVPCGKRVDKPLIASPEERYEMCGIALKVFLQENKHHCSNQTIIKLLDTEVSNGTSIPTFSLMKLYQQTYPAFEFWLLIGSDLLPTLSLWDNGTELKSTVNMIVYERPNYPLNSATLSGISTYINVVQVYKEMGKELPLFNISSTKVRHLLSEGFSEVALNYICPEVLAYIRTKGLYLNRLKFVDH